MKLITSLSLLAGIATIAPALAAETTEVATIPVGVVKMVIPGGNTLVSPVFVNADSFQGVSTSIVDSTDTSTITFASDIFTTGEFNEGEYPKFYVEVASGEAEGFAFDIISNDTDSVVVAARLVADFDLTQAESFKIRKHISVGQFFEGAALARRDSVKFFNADGTSDRLEFDGTQFEEGTERPIYPGTGFLSTLRGEVDIVTSGTVKVTNTVVPVYSNPGAINLVSTASPVDVFIEGLGLAGNLARRDKIRFLAAGTLDVLAIYEVQSDGSLELQEGSLDDVPAGEPFVVAVRGSANITLPKAYVQ
ncbi:hypothetical protein [Cerasicoccus arenae]|uniref:Uncharacterized protein n=1 Tax=Cerasicoccus arenae TaxID=424488 RepID=A0A8J3DAK0_9BACT|nr:hypothetical protein [Cerasicoccus arenae]MBK1857973.1 hypothetical protein [Cerasicoccus arenae]GHB97735.1 hypothetical protein GCM10007047_12000 [Cerasicoccus arenae]